MSVHAGAGKRAEHLAVARKMLRDANVESDSHSEDNYPDGDDCFTDPLSDSGEDDPDLAQHGGSLKLNARLQQETVPNRPPGPGQKDGASRPRCTSSISTMMPHSVSLNQPGAGPISPAAHQPSRRLVPTHVGTKLSRKREGKERSEDEQKDTISTRQVSSTSLMAHRGRSKAALDFDHDSASNDTRRESSGYLSQSSPCETSPEGRRSSTPSAGDRNSSTKKLATLKQEAIEQGMRLVEQERKQSEEMHQLLRKRIEFLTEELENTRAELGVKAKECEELMEVAEELDNELSRQKARDDSDTEETPDQNKAQTWLEKLQENLQLSASKPSKASGFSAVDERVCAVPMLWKMEVPSWLTFSPQKTPDVVNGAKRSSKHEAESARAGAKSTNKPKESRADSERKDANPGDKKRFQLC